MESKRKRGLAVSLGAALGAVFGVMAGHVGVWLSVGVAIGMALGMNFRRQQPPCPECAALHRAHEMK